MKLPLNPKFKRMKFSVFSFFVFALFSDIALAQYSIIPKPKHLIYGAGELQAGRNLRVHNFEDAYAGEAQYLIDILRTRNYVVEKKDVTSTRKLSDFVISLKYKKVSQNKEAYELALNEDGLTISAETPAGIFRGMMTALQILPVKPRSDFKLSFCTIKDEPTFPWRGLMLDVSRHFFSVDQVKAFIDKMAHYKFSVFHWHLTDDEGWRIQINAYPQLTDIGAWRVARTGKFGTRKEPQPGEPATYGGFYTQKEIRDVVDYAAQRHITIVPEIDVPGHSMALLAAMPALSTKKEPKSVSCGFKFAEWYGDGTFKMLVENMLNPAEPRVFGVLDTIFTEVAALFPGEYIHAGGDECYHGYWMEDEACQKLMRDNRLKNGEDLQAYFMKRVNDIIRSKGKKMIGWDEILNGGLAEGAAVMSWRGTKGGVEAAQKGHKVVMSPTTHAYLDYTQGDHSLEFPIYASLSLKKSYDMQIVPQGVDSSLIMGAQGNLWTEHIPTLSHAFYMAFPRAMAIAENAWGGSKDKDWTEFTSRVEAHFTKFENDNHAICKSLYDPWVEVQKNGNGFTCSMKTELPASEIRYTLDNTFPFNDSPLAGDEKIVIPEGEIILRAAVFRNGKQIGRTVSLNNDAILKRAK